MANSARKATSGPREPGTVTVNSTGGRRKALPSTAEIARTQPADELGDHVEHAVPRRDLAEPREGQSYGGIEMSPGLAPPPRIDETDRGGPHRHSHHGAPDERVGEHAAHRRLWVFEQCPEGAGRDHEQRQAGGFDQIFRPMPADSLDCAR